MFNQNWITNRVLLGSEPYHGMHYHDLRLAGVTHVIDMRVEAPPFEQEEANDARIVRHHFGINDGPDPNLQAAIGLAADTLAKILYQFPQAKVYVHCKAGISRSPTVVCAWLVRYVGMSLAGALQYVKKRRPQADPHPILWAALTEIMGSDMDQERIVL